jgi:hypothetical protein
MEILSATEKRTGRVGLIFSNGTATGGASRAAPRQPRGRGASHHGPSVGRQR